MIIKEYGYVDNSYFSYLLYKVSFSLEYSRYGDNLIDTIFNKVGYGELNTKLIEEFDNKQNAIKALSNYSSKVRMVNKNGVDYLEGIMYYVEKSEFINDTDDWFPTDVIAIADEQKFYDL